MAIYSQENTFYVYYYTRSKNSNNGSVGSPYYVGKGCKNRAFKWHRTISVPIDKTKIQIISENMNEADAFQLEILLIHLHGRIDLKTGILHNRTNGGDGAAGAIKSLATIQKYKRTRKLNPFHYSVEQLAKIRKARLEKYGSLYHGTKESVEKQLATKKRNGTFNSSTPEAIAKMLATKLTKYGKTSCVTPNSTAKGLATRKANGTLKTVTPESIAKRTITRKLNREKLSQITCPI